MTDETKLALQTVLYLISGFLFRIGLALLAIGFVIRMIMLAMKLVAIIDNHK